MDPRTRIFVSVGAFLGATVGLAYAMTYDLLCMCPGIPGACGCSHDEIFGWQPGWLAHPVWAAIGAISGVIVGLIADRALRRNRAS
jgi:hypothetical protein